MLKLTTALNQKLIEAYYNWNADNNMFRFNCVIDVGYLAEPLRKVLMKHKMFDPNTGTIILNLSVAACINIDFTGPEYYSEIGLQGMPCHLHIPWHAFQGVNVEVSENASVFAPFPSVDRILFDAANPTYQHPFRESDQAKHDIHIDDVISWLNANGHGEVSTAEAIGKFQALMEGDSEAFSDMINYVTERKNVRHLDSENAKEDFIVEKPESFQSVTKEVNIAQLIEKPVEEVAPLLDFGPLPGIKLKDGQSRYKGKPTLTVIKGGKA